MALRRIRRLTTATTALIVLHYTGPAEAQKAPGPKPPRATTPAPPKSLADSLPPEARTIFDAGKILFQDGDFATALLKFQDTYARTNDPRLLWNMAACQKNLRHYAKALDLIKKYVAEGDTKLTAEDRVDAAETAKAIEPFTTMATFKVSEDGADLFLDDESLGRTPLAGPIRVDIGMRKVRAKKEGFRTFAKDVPVGGASDVAIDVVIEREGGRLELRVAPDATVSIDEKEVGHGPVVSLDMAVGGHSLRITAPKMRPYQGEVAIEDGQTRSVEIKLEQDAEQFAELRVGVGCREADVHTPEQGLSVFLDESSVSASALGVRKRMEQGHEVVAYVPFTVSPGRHSVSVRYPGCLSLTTMTTALPQKPGVVEGILPPETRWLNGTPAGSPNGWVLAGGLTVNTLHFKSFNNLFRSNTMAQPAVASGDVGVQATGPSASIGMQKRWFTLLADARYIMGSTTGGPQWVSYGGPRPVVSQMSESASFHEGDIGLRMGPRFPIYFAALSFGAGTSLGVFSLAPSESGASSTTRLLFGGNLWGAIDAQPLCDWGLQVGGAASAVLDGFSSSTSTCSGGPTVCTAGVPTSSDPQPTFATTFFVQVAYEPNRLCEHDRAGLFRLDGTR